MQKEKPSVWRVFALAERFDFDLIERLAMAVFLEIS
jgi:hypothetical protein